MEGLPKVPPWTPAPGHLSTRAGLDVLRAVALRGPQGATVNEVMEDINASRSRAYSALEGLTTDGLVKSDPPQGQRRPRVPIRYVASHDAIESAVRDLGRWAHGVVEDADGGEHGGQSDACGAVEASQALNS
nr:helix-turn-helix domain-containing protein [Demequina litorisediminis]